MRYTVAGAATLSSALTTMGTPGDAYDGSLASGSQAVRVRTVLPADCDEACDDPASVTLTFSAPVTDPLVHVAGLALSSSDDVLLTSNAALVAVDGSALSVGDGRAVSAGRTASAACAEGTACGSLRVSGTVESITFTVPGTDAASSPVAVQDLRLSASVTAAAEPADPALTLDRAVAPRTVSRVGQQISYTLTAANAGDVPLTDVEIVDELDGLSDLTCSPAQPATLEPGETLRCTGTLEVTQAVLDFGGLYDVAQVFGEAPGGDLTDPSDDIGAVASGEVTITQSPALRLALTAEPTKAAAGDTVTYTFVTTNTGNVTVTRVAPSPGTFFAGLSCPTDRTLAPGATLTCTATHLVTDAEARTGSLTAKGLVHAERPFGDTAVTTDDVTARSTAVVTLTAPTTEPSATADPSSSSPVPPSSGATNGPTVTVPTTSTGPGVDSLPDTGGPSAILVGLGGLLAAAGTLLLARRRRA